MVQDLDLSLLPLLPQTHRLKSVVSELWQDAHVLALWLGGSLARDEGDAYSDVDLRVAVQTTAFEPDRLLILTPSLTNSVVATLPIQFGTDATLFHMLLEDGEIYDLFIQTTEHTPTDEIRKVLACRDNAFGAKLAGGKDRAILFVPADGNVIRQVLINFWIGQQKHQKVLYRDLPLLAWFGEHVLRQDLIRLWYVLATGNDCGPLQRMTIHTLSPVMRTVQQFVGDDALALLAQPLRSKEEIIDGTADLRDEVARVGRKLADQLMFEYPHAVEATVQQTWQQFRTS